MTSFRTLIAAGAAILLGFATGELRADGEVVTNEMSLAAGAQSSDAITIPANTVLKINVASGTGRLYGQITGEGKICKVGAGTLLLGYYKSKTEIFPAGGNTFAGGVDVLEGFFSADQNVTTPWGSGKITVHCENSAQLCFRSTIPNNVEFLGDSTAAKPGIYIGAATTMNGNIVAHGDVYYTDKDGYGNRPDTSNNVVFAMNGTLTLDQGKGFYASPCARISFNKVVTADLVKLYWTSMSGKSSYDCSPTHGNLGSVLFKVANNAVSKLEIDQTRVFCGAADCLTNTVVEFTGEHLANGWGYFDINGNHMYKIGQLITPQNVTEGCQVINSSSSSKQFTVLNSSGNYTSVEFDGPISPNFGYTLTGGLTLAPRQHTISGSLAANCKLIFSDGCTFDRLTGLTFSNSSTQDRLAELPDGYFASVRTITLNSSYVYIRPGLFTPRAVALILQSKGTDEMLRPATSPMRFEVASLKTRSSTGVDTVQKNGVYTHVDSSVDSGLCKIGTGLSVYVYGSDSPQTPITWKGSENDSSVTSAANWEDGNGTQLTTPPTLDPPCCVATFVKEGSTATRAEISADTYFDGIKFGNVGGEAGGTFTLAKADGSGDPVIRLGASSLTFLDDDSESSVIHEYAVEPKLEMIGTAARTWTVNTNVLLSLPGGIAGSANITVNGRGDIMLGASPDYSGQLSLDRLDAFVTGEIGKDGSSGKFTFAPNTSNKTEPYYHGNLTLSNAVFNVPVTLSSGGSIGAPTANSTTWYRTCDWTTNVYRKPVTLSGSGWIRGSIGSENVFGDSFSFVKTFVLGGGGEGGTTKATKQNPAVFRFQGPVISTYSAKLTDKQPYAGDFESMSNTGYVKVIFEHDGGVMRCGQLQAANEIVYEFRVNYVFGDGGARVSGTSGTYDLTSTTQNFGHPIASAGGAGIIFTGTAGSCARFVDAWAKDEATAALTNINKSVFAGALGLTFAPTNSTWLRIADSTSTMTGAITVEGGTLEFYGSTTFKNASAVNISGGTLKVGANTLLSRHAEVAIAEGAKIDIPSGTTLVVGPTTYNGTQLAPGAHSTEEFITGGGTLKVSNMGTCFIVK